MVALRNLFSSFALILISAFSAFAAIPGVPTDDNFFDYISKYFGLARNVALALAAISFFMVIWKYKKGDPQDKEALPRWIIAFVLMLIAAAVITVIETTAGI